MAKGELPKRETPAALWYTQGGGIARTAAVGHSVWDELPDWMAQLPDSR